MNNSLKKPENTWLAGASDNEVVLASRVRLARNFAGIPFPNRANAQQLEAVLMKAGNTFNDIENALKKGWMCWILKSWAALNSRC